MAQQALFGHPSYRRPLAMSLSDLGLAVFAPSSDYVVCPPQPVVAGRERGGRC